MAHRALITGPIIACCLESLFAAAGEATGSSGLCTVNVHKNYVILKVFFHIYQSLQSFDAKLDTIVVNCKKGESFLLSVTS